MPCYGFADHEKEMAPIVVFSQGRPYGFIVLPPLPRSLSTCALASKEGRRANAVLLVRKCSGRFSCRDHKIFPMETLLCAC